MDLSLLTTTIMDSTTAGSVPTAEYAPAQARLPLGESGYEPRVDFAGGASSDNSKFNASEKVSGTPRRDFGETLEQQIRKNSPQDDRPAGEVRSDSRKPSDPQKTEKAQEPANEASSQASEKPVQVSADQNANPVAAKACKAVDAKAVQTVTANVHVDAASATGPTSKDANPLSRQVKGAEPTTVTSHVPENKTQDAPAPALTQDKAVQPLQKNADLAASAEKTASSTQQATNGKAEKGGQQGARQSQADSKLTAAPTTGQSDATKTDSPVIPGKTEYAKSAAAADAKPQTSQVKAQPETQTVDTESKPNSPKPKTDVKDSGFSDSSEGKSRQPQGKAGSLPDGAVVQKSVVNATQTPVSQTVKQDRVESKDSVKSGPEQIMPQESTATAGSGRVSSVAQTPKAAGGNPVPEESAAVARQIQESFSTAVRQGDQQITIRLNPPELGSVQMSIKEQGSQITGLLEVSEMQTRAEIQQTLPQIVRNLQDMGINVKRLDVTLVSEQDHHASLGQSLTGQQDNRTGADGSTGGGTQAGESDWLASTEWLGGPNGYSDGLSAYGAYVTDTSINMLV